MSTSASQPEEYDFVILGSGEAGKYLAWTLAKQGKKVAVIERKYVGGSCPNIACLPSKNVIYSAKIATYFRRSEEFGITKENWKIDMAGVCERKRKMVAGLVDLHLDLYKKSGAELVPGRGQFIGPKTIEVTAADGGKRVLRGHKVILCTGSRAAIDSTPGLAEANPLTHVEALELDQIPQHILILGGGYVGIEFAQALRRFGSRVTVIERNSRLAHREDEDVSAELQELFRDEGIEVVTNVRVNRVEGKSGESIKLHSQREGSEIVLEGTHLLVAGGRVPNTAGIGLELAGVELTEHGHIKVNERLETTAPDIWAVGDCAGSPHFTHVAFDDFRIVRDNLAGGHRVTTGRQVPFCMFTDPEFARIGLSETEAKERGVPYRLSKVPLNVILRTRTISEPRGFLKALIETTSDRILGFTAFGVEAGEIIATVQVAMLAGLPYTALRDAIFTHPTMLEGLVALFFSRARQTDIVAGSKIAQYSGMAFRIHDSVVRGEIDSRTKGIVRGKIWVAGRDEPVVLELMGNPWPDLAGCLLTFTNPLKLVAHHHLDSLRPLQKGQIGDFTASRKVRVFDVPIEEAMAMYRRKEKPPEHTANSLYLEWFSEANGRVVVESADYNLTISPPEWRLTPEEEAQRAQEAAAGMAEFMKKLSDAIETQQRGQKDPEAEWDEHNYEQFLKECDARTDKYGELLDKYGDSDEAEEKIAKEMGWDDTDGKGHDEQISGEGTNAIFETAENEPPPELDPAREGIDWMRNEDGEICHPLEHRYFESSIKFWREADKLGLDKSVDKDLEQFIFEFQTTGAKLAGALGGIARGERSTDPAFTVACLKRALDHLHKSQAGLEAVAPKKLLPETMVAEARQELHGIRTDILQLMDRFRGRS